MAILCTRFPNLPTCATFGLPPPCPDAWVPGSDTALCGLSPVLHRSLYIIPSILLFLLLFKLMPSLDYWLWISVLASLASTSVLRHRVQGTNDNGPSLTSVPESAIEILHPPPSLDLSWPAIHSSNITRAISLGFDQIAAAFSAPICNGNLYGFNLDVASCHEAWMLIPRDDIARTFGLRGHGSFDIPIPFLFMSCKRI